MIGDTLCKNTMTGRFFLRAVKALVMVTLSDSFRIWTPIIVRHFGATFKKPQKNLHFPTIV